MRCAFTHKPAILHCIVNKPFFFKLLYKVIFILCAIMHSTSRYQMWIMEDTNIVHLSINHSLLITVPKLIYKLKFIMSHAFTMKQIQSSITPNSSSSFYFLHHHDSLCSLSAMWVTSLHIKEEKLQRYNAKIQTNPQTRYLFLPWL